MQISLSGIGSETLLSDFDSAGIKYIKCPHSVGVIMAGGETVQILKDISAIVPWESIAAVLFAWLKYRPSRKIIITTASNEVVHVEGYSQKELALLLPSCAKLMALETKKPKE